MKPRAGDYERDAESGLLLPRHARRGLARAHPQFMCGPGFFDGGAASDPYWSSVVALLHSDGTNGSSQFFDEKSTRKNSWSANGNASISTSQSKFGGASLALDGSGDSVSTSKGYALETTGDLTIECWVYMSSQHDGCIYSNYGGSSSLRNLLYNTSTGALTWYYNSSGNFSTASGTLANNTWHHIALVKQQGSPATFNIYVDGVEKASTTASQAAFGVNSDSGLHIGYAMWTGRYFNGYVDEFRVTNGVARYTAGFTPPSAAFPETLAEDANFHKVTALLHLNGSNGSTTITESASGRYFRVYGNANTSTAQSKFGGASASFDGSGDSISTPYSSDFAMGTGDFTLECFVRIANGTSEQVLLCLRDGPGSVYNNVVRISGNKIGWSNGSVWREHSSTVTNNTWTHVAVTRASNTLRIFQDGVQGFSGTESGNLSGDRPLFIGSVDQESSFLNGYIDEVRITKGIARYTANFTPPSAPFPNS